jgi:hypothetical protein
MHSHAHTRTHAHTLSRGHTHSHAHTCTHRLLDLLIRDKVLPDVAEIHTVPIGGSAATDIGTMTGRL